ncbi:MAG: hypothetical protein M3430_01195 [Acidobacteriota bacterium]|nr:hypothetical protein [Acidobacteriota bacterium]
MKGKLVFLTIIALISFAPSIFAQAGERQQPVDESTDPTAHAVSVYQVTGEIRAVSYPREQTVKQLRILLAPASITIEEAQFEDRRRFKNNFSVIVEWDPDPVPPK